MPVHKPSPCKKKSKRGVIVATAHLGTGALRKCALKLTEFADPKVKSSPSSTACKPVFATAMLALVGARCAALGLTTALGWHCAAIQPRNKKPVWP